MHRVPTVPIEAELRVENNQTKVSVEVRSNRSVAGVG